LRKVDTSEKKSPPPSSVQKPIATVRRAIQELGDRFGNREIGEAVKKIFNLTMESKQISSALNKLAKNKEIRQVVAGIGRRPAIYEKQEVTA
jgi:hypothetical protein